MRVSTVEEGKHEDCSGFAFEAWRSVTPLVCPHQPQNLLPVVRTDCLPFCFAWGNLFTSCFT